MMAEQVKISPTRADIPSSGVALDLESEAPGTHTPRVPRGRHGFDGSNKTLGACRGSDSLVNPADNF